MASKKHVYVHFEGAGYVSAKSEVLKTQMETLYIKKLIKNLVLTRERKRHYNLMLKHTYQELKKKVEKLDSLMPEDKEEFNSLSKVIKKTFESTKAKKSSPKKKQEIIETEPDSIEEELLKIKEKLDSLNRV